MEKFFRRLEIYTEMPPTALEKMTSIIIQIVVEVLSILGIATKKIKQGRLSKYSLYKYITVNGTMSRKICKQADPKDG